MTNRPHEWRWVSCSKDADWATAQYRHLNIKGSLHTFCGCTASHPEVWRGNSQKPFCPKCYEHAIDLPGNILDLT